MTNIRELLHELARPRLAGSAGAREVAAILRTRLSALGYDLHDFPFTFSSIPGRFAVSICGVLFIAGTVSAAALLNMRQPGVALVVLMTLVFVAGGIAALEAPMTQILPFGRIQTANMLAVRPGVRPRYIVMAHLDSKSQPLPLAFRGPAIIVALLSWAGFASLAILGVLDPVWLVPTLTTALAVVCVIAGVLLILCWTQNESPGALDNASGLVTIVGLAERADWDDVAFLITDAEEFGMVGARAIARAMDPVIGIINIDGVDDHGPFYVLERFGFPRRHFAPHLAAALLTAADQMNLPAHRRDVPIGLYLDHIPLAQAQQPAVSIMRGTVMQSMRRVHRPTDSPDVMNGTGIESAIELVSQALAVLHRQPTGASL